MALHPKYLQPKLVSPLMSLVTWAAEGLMGQRWGTELLIRRLPDPS